MGGWRQWFEPEESIGTLWHRATERLAPLAHHPEASVRLETERGRLAVLFRGLGGSGGVELKPRAAQQSAHRLSRLRRVAIDAERVTMAHFDGVILSLPEVIDTFADPKLNSDLYLWLVALSAFLVPPDSVPTDPLEADLAALRRIDEAVKTTLAACLGLRPVYARLAAATLAGRTDQRLPPAEHAVEAMIRELLSNAARPAPRAGASTFLDEDVSPQPAPLDYKPFRPVPLWPIVARVPRASRKSGGRDDEAGTGSADAAEKRLNAERRQADQADRKDSLILHRFEHILSWTEFLNINRAVDDEDEESARKVADDADRIAVVKNRKKATTKLKFDLDLSPEDVDLEKLSGTNLYPE